MNKTNMREKGEKFEVAEKQKKIDDFIL